MFVSLSSIFWILFATATGTINKKTTNQHQFFRQALCLIMPCWCFLSLTHMLILTWFESIRKFTPHAAYFDTFDMTASSIGVYVVCRGRVLLGTVNKSKTMLIIDHWWSNHRCRGCFFYNCGFDILSSGLIIFSGSTRQSLGVDNCRWYCTCNWCSVLYNSQRGTKKLDSTSPWFSRVELCNYRVSGAIHSTWLQYYVQEDLAYLYSIIKVLKYIFWGRPCIFVLDCQNPEIINLELVDPSFDIIKYFEKSANYWL